MINGKKVAVVMPAFNAERTLEKTVRGLPETVDIKEVNEDIWLVSFTDCDLGYFDLETRVLEPLENPFGPKLSPM